MNATASRSEKETRRKKKKKRGFAGATKRHRCCDFSFRRPHLLPCRRMALVVLLLGQSVGAEKSRVEER